MNKGLTYALFATPVHCNNIGTDYKIEVNDLRPCYTSTLSPKSYDKCNGLITRDQNYLLQKNNQVLKENIEEVIQVYLYDNLKINRRIGIKHQCSWGLVHKKGHYSPKHYHRNAWLSGIYYFQVNKNSGNLEVFDNPPYGWTCNSMAPFDAVNEYNALNSTEYAFEPNPGDIFIFPAHLHHQSYMNNSDEDRICISFNYTLSGCWGGMTEQITLN